MFDTSRPGPFDEDLEVGAALPPLPSITITDADNTFYRAVTGDQHPLAADATIYRAAGGTGLLANPGRLMRFEVIGATLTDDGGRTEVLRWAPIVWAP
jgi:acyl dehydratase